MSYRLLSACLALASGCALQAAPSAVQSKPIGTATLRDARGADAGRVVLTRERAMIHGTVTAKGLTPGVHGIHLHAVGKCDAPGFTTAGAHLNPDNRQHGLKNPQGAHQGDLPNLTVGADGMGTTSFIAHATPASIFDKDGTAFIVHAGPDDDVTDPSGNSGGRQLCGVLERAR